VRTVASDLGVRYVLEGSVRGSGKRLRITAQLVDAETGMHIWAEKYDRSPEDVFAIQDEITQHVVAAIEPHLYAEEGHRLRSRPPESLDSWGLVVRALGLINRVGRQENLDAQALLRRAIEAEPGYARAHALLGWAQWWMAFAAWDEDRQGCLDRALASAARALALDPDEPWGRMVSGLLLSTNGTHERAIGELETAIRLNPSFALAHTVHGLVLLRAGRFDAAIEMTRKACRMSPVDSFAGMYTSYHGLALLAARRFDEALPLLRASLAALPEFIGHYNTLISCCGHLGLLDEAKVYIASRNRIGPPLSLALLRRNLGKFAHCDVFVEGLAKAGIPEMAIDFAPRALTAR
jgi:adenylate cyclase